MTESRIVVLAGHPPGPDSVLPAVVDLLERGGATVQMRTAPCRGKWSGWSPAPTS